MIEQVGQYKYLGIELTRTLRWNVYLKRILDKARRNMTQALAMGVGGGFMRTRLENIIWMSLVRSIIEYGCEIWGGGTLVELEKLQIAIGKRNLVGRGTIARRDEMRLRFWAKIVRMHTEKNLQGKQGGATKGRKRSTTFDKNMV